MSKEQTPRKRGLFWITWKEKNCNQSPSTIGGWKYYYEPLWYYVLHKLKPKQR